MILESTLLSPPGGSMNRDQSYRSYGKYDGYDSISHSGDIRLGWIMAMLMESERGYEDVMGDSADEEGVGVQTGTNDIDPGEHSPLWEDEDRDCTEDKSGPDDTVQHDGEE
jgi:hypothetical protein